MSNEDSQTQEAPKQEVSRGDRGVVGTATAGLTIKQRWGAEGRGLSLKSFARKLAKDGDQIAKDWFAHKRGSMNQKRTDKNIADAKAAGLATKTERRKKKGEGK